MTALREALTAAIAVVNTPRNFRGPDDVWACRDLIRDHGPALLEALDDAERVVYLESLREGSILEYNAPFGHNILEPRYVVLSDDNDERLGSGATVREAIDDAMRSCPSGTNGSLDLIAERARERKP